MWVWLTTAAADGAAVEVQAATLATDTVPTEHSHLGGALLERWCGLLSAASSVMASLIRLRRVRAVVVPRPG
jgi:hypothetical protein